MGIYELSAGSADDLVTIESPLNSFYRNQGTIESNGTVLAGQSTKMFSEESITLTQGFHAQAGSNFLAKIEDCAIPTESFASIKERAKENVFDNAENISFNIAPNPFSTATIIRIRVPKSEEVRQLRLLDNTGKIIHQLIHNSNNVSNDLEVVLNRDFLAGGFYFLSLQTNREIYTKRIVVL